MVLALRTNGPPMDLAAAAERLLAAVVGRGLALAVAGIVGAAAALSLSRFTGAQPYGVSAADPATLAAVAALLVAVAAAACYVPARRVLAVDPTEALRSE